MQNVNRRLSHSKQLVRHPVLQFEIFGGSLSLSRGFKEYENTFLTLGRVGAALLNKIQPRSAHVSLRALKTRLARGPEKIIASSLLVFTDLVDVFSGHSVGYTGPRIEMFE